MQVFSSHRTMSGAKPKFRIVEPEEISRLEARKIRLAAEEAARQRREAELDAVIRTQRQEANRAIAMANAALARMNFVSSTDRIIGRISRATGISPRLILSEQRSRGIVFARQAVMYWCARLTGQSLPQIGRKMGGRDHTTVLHGKRQYPKKRALMGRHLRSLDR